MAGYISEFFGYQAEDNSEAALVAAEQKRCPFLKAQCTKILSRDRAISGVCSIQQKSAHSPRVICCPNRIYAEDYKMLHTISQSAFRKQLNWYTGELVGFTAIEVQTIDTTGNYRDAREALLSNRRIESSTVGLNWENVSKRIIPQLIYKGQVLQREDLCRTGLYFICPQPVYDRVLKRLGGKEKLPKFPTQPASIHFVSYDYLDDETPAPGTIAPLGVIEEHTTTVYKVQEAFSSLSLPEGNVYRDALRRSLYGSSEYRFDASVYPIVAEKQGEYGK